MLGGEISQGTHLILYRDFAKLLIDGAFPISAAPRCASAVKTNNDVSLIRDPLIDKIRFRALLNPIKTGTCVDINNDGVLLGRVEIPGTNNTADEFGIRPGKFDARIVRRLFRNAG